MVEIHSKGADAPAGLESNGYGKLSEALNWSSKQMQQQRQTRREILRHYVGHNLRFKGGWKDKVPLNFIRLYMNIFGRHLASSNPVPLVTTKATQLKAKAFAFELALTHLLQELKFGAIHRQLVREALMVGGYAKLGVAWCGDSQIEGLYHDMLRPYVKCLSYDDLRLDMRARHWDDQVFIGDTYRVDLDAAKAYKLWRKKAREALGKDDSTDSGKLESEQGGDTRAEALGRELASAPDASSNVEVIDIYLPHKNQLLTFPNRAGGFTQENLLYSGEWAGPERGPYRRLAFEDVPDNVLSIGPAMNWLPLHESLNMLDNKQIRQAIRQKQLLLYSPAGSKNAENVRDFADGMAVESTDPKSTQQANFGGPDQVVFGFIMQHISMLNKMAGNPDALGGIGPSADTLGQEEMIAGSQSKQLAEMHDRDQDFVADLMSALGWYEWHDPERTRMMKYKVPGTECEVDIPWTPEDREADFYDMNIQIEPYSMRHENPAQKLAGLRAFVQDMGLVMQAGGLISPDGYARLFARYANLTDLEDLYTGQTPPPPHLDEAQPKAAGKHQYEHISRSGRNTQGREQDMISQLMGAKLQDKQMGGMGGAV